MPMNQLSIAKCIDHYKPQPLNFLIIFFLTVHFQYNQYNTGYCKINRSIDVLKYIQGIK